MLSALLSPVCRRRTPKDCTYIYIKIFNSTPTYMTFEGLPDSGTVRVRGSGHSFVPLADVEGDGAVVTLRNLPRKFDLDVKQSTITVDGGATLVSDNEITLPPPSTLYLWQTRAAPYVLTCAIYADVITSHRPSSRTTCKGLASLWLVPNHPKPALCYRDRDTEREL